jgi:hypothetical protein
MRNLIVSLLVLAACGGGSSELKGARTAHYKGDKLEIFHAVRSAVESKYRIEKSDENSLILETAGRWFNPEGQGASERMDDIRDVPDKSLHIHFIIALVADGDAFVVDVKPKWFRRVAGSPQPQPLKEDDISIPGWATGKVDQLAVAVHDALTKYEVKSVPGQVPAGSAAPATPAPAPTEPAPTPAAPQ